MNEEKKSFTELQMKGLLKKSNLTTSEDFTERLIFQLANEKVSKTKTENIYIGSLWKVISGILTGIALVIAGLSVGNIPELHFTVLTLNTFKTFVFIAILLSVFIAVNRFLKLYFSAKKEKYYA